MAFADVAADPGLKRWRVEQLAPVEQAAVQEKLFTGDAYIFLEVAEQAPGSLSHRIHFWIGAECSQDEAGGAAVLSVQLDQTLTAKGHEASISRHVQGKESAEFLALFPNGLQTSPGGVASALSAPDLATTPVLYRISGSRRFRITHMPLEAASLTAPDGFVADVPAEKLIIQWVAPGAGHMLKFRTMDLAVELRDTVHAGDAQVRVLETGETGSELAKSFYGLVGIADAASFTPSQRSEAEAEPAASKAWAVEYSVEGGEGSCGWPLQAAGSDAKAYNEDNVEKSLASKKVHEVPDALTAHMLSADAMLVVTASGTTWVWVGKYVPVALRNEALELATQVSPPDSSAVATEVVKQGLEGPVFKSLFPDWRALQKEAAFAAKKEVTETEGFKKAAVDVQAMVAGVQAEPVTEPLQGTKKVWRVHSVDAELQTEVVPEDQHGTFSTGDCYVVLVKPEAPEKPVLYFWQGAKSSVTERSACAVFAVQVDQDECNGDAVQVRVVEGKEPAHFTGLWAGAMVVYEGSSTAGFRTLQQSDASGETAPRLFHIKATGAKGATAMEVQAQAASLNSSDVFVLIADKAFLWSGSGASADERETGLTVLANLTTGATEREQVQVAEGEEPEDFWSALGGKGEYARVSASASPEPTRFFVLSDAPTGGVGVSAEEVPHFSQADLCSSDVVLLDAYATLYLWLGADSSKQEASAAADVAKQYLQTAGRDPDTAVVIVKQGNEPALFTSHFHGWDSKKGVRSLAEYEAGVGALKGAAAAQGSAAAAAAGEGATEAANAAGSSVAELQGALDAASKKANGLEQVKVTRSVSGVASNASRTSSPSKHSFTGEPRTGILTPHTVRGGEFVVSTEDPSGTKGTGDYKFSIGKDFFELSELPNMKGADGIDPERKEMYLTDEVFEKTFGMSKDAFCNLPLWRRQTHKKAVNLF